MPQNVAKLKLLLWVRLDIISIAGSPVFPPFLGLKSNVLPNTLSLIQFNLSLYFQTFHIAKMSDLTTDLTGHVCLVTGGTGGIGKATCYALAKMGCAVAIHYSQAQSTAQEMVKDFQAQGIKAEGFQADLSNYDQVWHCRKMRPGPVIRTFLPCIQVVCLP